MLNDPSAEEWRPVVGMEGRYEVSSIGRVRSLDHMAFRKRSKGTPIKGRILTPWLLRGGYLAVRLGRGKNLMLHRLVAAAFLGPEPEGCEVCHYDGNKANNIVENLRYDTRSANAEDRKRQGTYLCGEQIVHLVKLTEKQVREIKALKGIISQSKIGAMYGVSQTNIGHIHRGVSWKHVE